ncbi:MAG TPA: sigma-E factor regulatory protein RseB domain-containing protein, partial [Marinobacter sp.]
MVIAVLVAGPARAEAVAKDAEYWLDRLGPALNMTSYRGVFVYARGDQVSSMQIAHRYQDGVVEERLVPQ